MDLSKLKMAMEIAEMMGDSATSAPVGRPVIVRSRDAGVLFGTYNGNEGDTVHLKNARQLWKWKASKGGTLIDVARHGVDADGCKFSDALSNTTVFNACALIDVSDEAAKSIAEVNSSEAWS